MVSDADGGTRDAGLEALRRLKSTEPPLYLTPSPELSKAARSGSEYLFSALKPYSPKCPFNQLLTEGFDAEQIWQQIDLQAQPLISTLRRHVRNFEKNPEEIQRQFNLGGVRGKEKDVHGNGERKDNEGVESESEGISDDDDDDEKEGIPEEEEEEEEDDDDDDDEDEDEEEEGRGEEDVEMEDNNENVNGVEDKFLKIKELEEYLLEDEAREYGLKKDKKHKRNRATEDEDEDGTDEDEDDEEEDEDEEDELGLMDDDADVEERNEMENARYEDFFGGKKTDKRKQSKTFGGSDDMEAYPNGHNSNQKQDLSTHEKELEILRTEIEEMEKANLEPKAWTMQGEVTAAKRPKNSALEVDLDFEHNVRPAPVITEEVTASLEELIQKRIIEGQFDDVEKKPTLLTKAPTERKELDENKSKKGLAEIYEDEYAQKTGLVSTALSFSDEQKKEATLLFKKLCVKLDALSHFHFAPKPIIEDMSIQANLPALAMEEVAPLAVSDAAMLAPEEVFSGKGDIKDETELTKEDRKRRRANKKRKFKAASAKTIIVKPQQSTSTRHANGIENS
ncbi:M phase phosphoprotein 10 isoform X2 [Andrographis paniculata]|uniref:M phase phosphoprotein 10 isoform X2 n=1 Tax=Andrographis paniculata TaxID=175694 RepID=UPI0021E91E9D|nr:M phase phosphoprotein 10 isoform X2 [Andrographis paniculata]